MTATVSNVGEEKRMKRRLPESIQGKTEAEKAKEGNDTEKKKRRRPDQSKSEAVGARAASPPRSDRAHCASASAMSLCTAQRVAADAAV